MVSEHLHSINKTYTNSDITNVLLQIRYDFHGIDLHSWLNSKVKHLCYLYTSNQFRDRDEAIYEFEHILKTDYIQNQWTYAVYVVDLEPQNRICLNTILDVETGMFTDFDTHNAPFIVYFPSLDSSVDHQIEELVK